MKTVLLSLLMVVGASAFANPYAYRAYALPFDKWLSGDTAVEDNPVYGVGFGENEGGAEFKAKSECNASTGGDCKIIKCTEGTSVEYYILRQWTTYVCTNGILKAQ